jgi:hypothetical protein
MRDAMPCDAQLYAIDLFIANYGFCVQQAIFRHEAGFRVVRPVDSTTVVVRTS